MKEMKGTLLSETSFRFLMNQTIYLLFFNNVLDSPWSEKCIGFIMVQFYFHANLKNKICGRKIAHRIVTNEMLF